MAVALVKKMDLTGYHGNTSSKDPVADAARDFARGLHDRWGVGGTIRDCGDTGILLFLSVQDRAIFVSTGSAVQKVLTEERLATVIDGMKPHLRNGNFGNAVRAAIFHMDDLLLQQAYATAAHPTPEANHVAPLNKDDPPENEVCDESEPTGREPPTETLHEHEHKREPPRGRDPPASTEGNTEKGDIHDDSTVEFTHPMGRDPPASDDEDTTDGELNGSESKTTAQDTDKSVESDRSNERPETATHTHTHARKQMDPPGTATAELDATHNVKPNDPLPPTKNTPKDKQNVNKAHPPQEKTSPTPAQKKVATLNDEFAFFLVVVAIFLIASFLLIMFTQTEPKMVAKRPGQSSLGGREGTVRDQTSGSHKKKHDHGEASSPIQVRSLSSDRSKALGEKHKVSAVQRDRATPSSHFGGGKSSGGSGATW